MIAVISTSVDISTSFSRQMVDIKKGKLLREKYSNVVSRAVAHTHKFYFPVASLFSILSFSCSLIATTSCCDALKAALA